MHDHSGYECIRVQSEKPVEILLRPLTADYGGRDGGGKPDAGRQMTDNGQEKTTEDRSRFA